jgi:hypothetical protein
MFRILHDISCGFGELKKANYDSINWIDVLILFTIQYYSHVFEIIMILLIVALGQMYA